MALKTGHTLPAIFKFSPLILGIGLCCPLVSDLSVYPITHITNSQLYPNLGGLGVVDADVAHILFSL